MFYFGDSEQTHAGCIKQFKMEITELKCVCLSSDECLCRRRESSKRESEAGGRASPVVKERPKDSWAVIQ